MLFSCLFSFSNLGLEVLFSLLLALISSLKAFQIVLSEWGNSSISSGFSFIFSFKGSITGMFEFSFF
ncbi:MAG: hypothetical protein CMJ13_03550 [Pelagibacterales bacterium]|nr:hypothetical protein [Pelagibacterales bacterium]